jgi:hypothetical protein
MPQASVSSLRKFIRPRDAEEHCDLCGGSLTASHIHQFDPSSRRIRCACESCARLYSTTYREIPRRVRTLTNFQITDAQWDELMIPISLAFFTHSTPAGRPVALYPGPAGAAESLLDLSAWGDIAAANPELEEMQPDVEALLVNRVGSVREYFLVPIDECYKLVGLIRVHWRGLSGGAVVWGEIAQFFNNLRRRGAACPV